MHMYERKQEQYPVFLTNGSYVSLRHLYHQPSIGRQSRCRRLWRYLLLEFPTPIPECDSFRNVTTLLSCSRDRKTLIGGHRGNLNKTYRTCESVICHSTTRSMYATNVGSWSAPFHTSPDRDAHLWSDCSIYAFATQMAGRKRIYANLVFFLSHPVQTEPDGNVKHVPGSATIATYITSAARVKDLLVRLPFGSETWYT